jgi:hypothetical protein
LRYVLSGASHVKEEDVVCALKKIRIEEGGDMMATLAQQWLEKGMVEEAREMVQEAISSRFGTVPEDIAGEIGRFEDRERLRVLLRQAVVCRDMEAFRKALAAARN